MMSGWLSFVFLVPELELLGRTTWESKKAKCVKTRKSDCCSGLFYSCDIAGRMPFSAFALASGSWIVLS